ncbi:hypothetical protein Pmani_016686 [Petrolisthes manimaculis]|uniref:Peptidase S8 pro-domain domain-containing protein n=1 Tax=Petrolisthes manimaculis TaxID=1843537 RepID=A0AAE1PNQ4_9EUCA|nr:hypothetical protein Pmani_016686 [Petrolisthes manimaculis]
MVSSPLPRGGGGGLVWLLLALMAMAAAPPGLATQPHVFTNSFLVRLKPLVPTHTAKDLALKHGFEYLGQVSVYINSSTPYLLTLPVDTPNVCSPGTILLCG